MKTVASRAIVGSMGWMAALTLVALAGCWQSHEVVPSSGPRAATSPQQVKTLPELPRKYEDLGVISVVVTPEMKWDESGDATPAFDALRAKAASLGANAMLLTVDPSQYNALVAARDHGKMFQLPMRYNPNSIVAHAVYVIKE